MPATWTKEEPASTTFDGNDGTNNYKLVITTNGGGKRATLTRVEDSVGLGQIDFPSTPFIKDMFTQVGDLL